MTTFVQESVGERIARLRKIRHLTQAGLSQAARVSLSHVSQIEQGRRQPSDVVLASIARALSVPVADLTGQPYMAELRQDQLDALIQPLRESLDVFDLGVDPELQPRPATALAEHAENLAALIRTSDLRTVAAELPALIAETTTAAHADGAPAVWRTLAGLYRTAFDVTSKLGYFDLASISLDRVGWAAERGSDAHADAVRHYNRALTYLRAGDYRTGLRITRLAMATVGQAEAGIARTAVEGQIHLASSILSARAQDPDAVTAHIAEAQRAADVTGEVHKLMWLSFGPANVKVHHASALIDQDLYGEALELARTIVLPEDWPASRGSHFYGEISRAQLWTGRTDAAFRSLVKARQLAPQQARHSPAVRSTMAGVLRAQRSVSDSVAGFAGWLGL